jgi:DNA-binding XRE family transcriptional regulator
MGNIHLRVALLRSKKDLTQAELAARVDVDQRTISAIETGRRKPSIDLAIRLAKEFGVTLDDLLGKEEMVIVA